ncbi:MAG: hypothetical protein N2037_13175 [Acidimicrobiales bacterium]|nr:hypothetical protein [Acidimicrobiales bacterium]
MSTESDYTIHPTKARVAFGPGATAKAVILVKVDTTAGEFLVRAGDTERRFRCPTAADAAAHLDRAATAHDGYVALLNERQQLLALFVGTPGTTPPKRLEIYAHVARLENGSAIELATNNDDWVLRLYSIQPTDDNNDAAA